MPYDIIFLSNGEENADQHWQLLSSRFRRAKRVDGVKGILAAHKACANAAKTAFFFLVDADNEVTDFAFDYKVKRAHTKHAHVWFARNAVNGLEYAWGGIKLLPRKLVLAAAEETTDLFSSFRLITIEQVASISHFNTTPYSAWSSAFRECAKLAAWGGPSDIARLDTWCTVGADKPFGSYAILGAKEGKEWGLSFKDSLPDLDRINDYAFMRRLFEKRHGPKFGVATVQRANGALWSGLYRNP